MTKPEHKWNTWVLTKVPGFPIAPEEIGITASSKILAEAKALEMMKDAGVEFVCWTDSEGVERSMHPTWTVWRKPQFEDLEWAVHRVRHAIAHFIGRELETPGKGQALLTSAQANLSTVQEAMCQGVEWPASGPPPFNEMQMIRDFVGDQ